LQVLRLERTGRVGRNELGRWDIHFTLTRLVACFSQPRRALAAVNERLKAQAAKIDKVSAQVEVNRPAPQMAVNDQ
jgi:hypothetical protein